MNDIQAGQIPQWTKNDDGSSVLKVENATLNVDAAGNCELDAGGNRIEKVEGGIQVTRESGFQFQLMEHGGIRLITKPKSVGIHDLSQVASFTTSFEGDTTVHSVVFHNGDSARIIYKDGVFEELISAKLGHYLNGSDELFISQGGEPDA